MIESIDGKFWFNGERQERVIGRSSFKLANIITYHFTGQGGGEHSLGAAERWIEHNQSIFGEHVVLRVFLETGGWRPCDDCMFGSEPRDQGFWERGRLRDGVRERSMHAVGRQVLEWLFKTSEETGVALELVIDATLKHDDVPKGEIDHVIRQVGVEMGEISRRFPRSLVIPNLRNEWNAHNQAGHTLHDVNMWAVRWDRDQYWEDSAKIVDPGGGKEFTYDVGPEPGKYRAGMVHPDRGEGWERFPNQQQLSRLRTDARGMPVGFTESMYYVEPEDFDRARRWYRAGGWTTDWRRYRQFLEHAIPLVDYFIVHDEKGAQSDPLWPRPETRVEAWARERYNDGGVGPSPPDPEPPEPPEDPEDKMVVIEGRNFVLIRFPEPIEVDVERDGDAPYEKTFLLELKRPFIVDAVDSFFGHDRGDAYEMSVEVFSDKTAGMAEHARDFLFRRIDEDTAPGSAGSRYQEIVGRVDVRSLKLYVTCRVTGKNMLVEPEHLSYHKWRGVFDFNVMLIGGK